MKKASVSPFLSFTGKAEEAMRFYAASLPHTKIIELVRYGKGHPLSEAGDENKILHGALSMMGQEIMFLDMASAYPAPEFSWSTSLYVDCQDESEFDAIFNALSQDGFVMMGPEAVGLIRKCACVFVNPKTSQRL